MLILVPMIGERWAELFEMPFMLIGIVWIAMAIFRQSKLELNGRQLLVSGAIALGLLLSAELTLVLGMRGLTVAKYLAERDPVSGSVYVLMLGVFAIMPWLVGNRSGTRGTDDMKKQKTPLKLHLRFL